MNPLATFVSELQAEQLDDRTRGECARAFANVVGVAIGGVPLEATQRALATMKTLGGPGQARVIGSGAPLPVDRVALVDGIAAHVLDYDDTHLATILHPSAPVMAALLPLAEWRRASGTDFTIAFAAGLETGIRLAIALGRDHYDAGWHVTGTAGGVGAAAACARLLELSPEQTLHAIGIAATQASGHREQFGYMTKSLHVGAAGQAGLTAALLAADGFDASPVSLEGRRGLLETAAPAPRADALTAHLGERWDLLDNCLKPYASGVVTHPAIDATRALRDDGILAADIEEIVLDVNPLVMELTGKIDPPTGLEGKFSVTHCAAMGLLDGMAGPGQFTNDRVVADDVVELRGRIRAQADQQVAHMTAKLTARLRDGRSLDVTVDPARGTLERPLTDEELRVKFVDAASALLDEDKANQLFDLALGIDGIDDVSALVEATLP